MLNFINGVIDIEYYQCIAALLTTEFNTTQVSLLGHH